MSHIVVLGAGLSGTLMTYELIDQLRPEDTLTLIGEEPKYHFVPSNPWVAIGWRKRPEIEVDLHEILKRRNVEYVTAGAERVLPQENRIALRGGGSVSYDYLVIATGPELAFDEIPGLGPDAQTNSICHVSHAERTNVNFEELAKNPGPIVVGAVQGASCFGPAYEFAMILDTELKRRKIRDKVPMTFVTAEPYIGHLGLDGVGDTKGLLESEMRDRHIKWITSAKVTGIADGKVKVDEIGDDGSVKKSSEIAAKFTMLLPAFRGVGAVRGIEGLTNPRGFITIDNHQRNKTFPNIFGVGVCVAIPPVGPTPVPVGVPKTGFMIESMVTATAANIGALLRGKEANKEATWNAVCLADFGDSGVAFVAQPQIPPRNLNWAAEGKWVHLAKIGFEKYFLGKIRRGESEPFYEKFVLERLGITKLRETEQV